MFPTRICIPASGTGHSRRAQRKHAGPNTSLAPTVFATFQTTCTNKRLDRCYRNIIFTTLVHDPRGCLRRNPRQRSLKVIGTDTYRSAVYDFLLTFDGPISYHFLYINGDFSRKSQHFPVSPPSPQYRPLPSDLAQTPRYTSS